MRFGSRVASIAGKACEWLAVTSVRHGVTTVLVFALLAAASTAIAVRDLAVDTNPDQMISRTLPFRVGHFDLRKAFPALMNTFVVVIDAKTGDEGLDAARAVARAFAARPDLYDKVYAPGTGKFFEDYGLLYLPRAEVGKMVDNIGQAAPLLDILAQQPNIAGMADLVGGMAQAAGMGAVPAGMARILTAADTTLAAELSGKRKPLDWEALAGNESEDLPKRWYVLASPRLDYSKLDASAGPYNEARRVVSDPAIARNGEVKLHLTGEAAMNAEEFHAVIAGATAAGLASLVLVSVIVFFGLPLLRLNVAALALLVLGFLINAGFATIAVGHLNMISVAFAVLFIGLGVDYAVHVILRFCEEVRTGFALEDAVRRAADSAGPALALCTATTAVAFLSFTPTAFAGMAQLGVIAAAGTVIAFIGSLSLVPAILSFMPSVVPALRAKPPRAWTGIRRITGALRLPVTVAVIALAVVSIFLLQDVRFNGDPVDLKDPRSASVVMFKKLMDENPALTFSGELLIGPHQDAAKEKKRLTALPEVSEVTSLDSYFPHDQTAKLKLLAGLRQQLPPKIAPLGGLDGEALATALDRLGQTAAHLAQMPGAPADLRKAAGDLARRIDSFRHKEKGNPQALSRLDKAWFANFPATMQRLILLASAAPVTANNIDPALRDRFIAPDGRQRLEVVPSGDMRKTAQLDRFVDAVTRVAPATVGPPVEIVGSARAVADAMTRAVIFALALVVIAVTPVLRRPLDIALVLAPLLLAALLLCGYTVVFHAPFNFANVIVLPLLLGLGVDSSIHYVMRAREHHEDHIVDTSTPRAVLVSALTTIGSFGTLWLSPHRGMASMGELLTIAIIVTLITTLVVLPQLIAWADRVFPPPPRQPLTWRTGCA